MNKIIYKIIYGFLWLFTLIPFPVIYVISDITYFFAYYIVCYRKKIVLANLNAAFPDKSKKEIKLIAKKYYRHISDFIFESIKSIHMSHKNYKKHFHLINPAVFDELYKAGKDIALVSGHYGNWEWALDLPNYVKHRFFVIYRPLKNKYSDIFINKQRSKFKLEMVPMKKIYRKMLETKKTGENIMIWFLGDQRPPRKKAQYYTTFLNMETGFFTGTEKTAQKLDAAVVFMNIDKEKRGHYQVEFIKLFDNAKNTSEYEITNKHIRTLEKIIQKKPEYWLWSHRRWRGKNKKIYD